MTRAVGNHSSASADYSLLRKRRFLSCRNSIMRSKKKKKSSTSGLVRLSLLHFGGFNLTRKVCKHYLNHCAYWCVHGGGFF